MKLTTKSIQLSVSLAALFFAQSSFAGVNGTEAGTVVSNTATLSYSVGGAEQSDILSKDEDGNATTTFTVDQKVDLTVTGDSTPNILVGPSSKRSVAANKLTYVLSNDGNLEQAFKIAVSHLTNDDFNAGETPTTTAPLAAEACQFSVIGGTTVPAGPHAMTDTPIVTLGTDTADKEAVIEVTCSMPNRPDVDDGSLSTIDVLATAVDGTGTIMKESTIADREDEIDVVLADGVGDAASDIGGPDSDGKRNAMHSDTQTFEINAPMLSVVKTSKVISDPYNDITNPKRIPGAIVEYTIAISNSSDSEATGVKIADIIQGAGVTVDFVAGSIVSDSVVTTGSTDDTLNTEFEYQGTTVIAKGLTVPAASASVDGKIEVTFKVKIL